MTNQKNLDTLYDDDFIKNIAEKLSLNEGYTTKNLKESLTRAAENYIYFKKQRQRSLTPKVASKLIKNFIKKGEELQDIWEKMSQDFYINHTRNSVVLHTTIMENQKTYRPIKPETIPKDILDEEIDPIEDFEKLLNLNIRIAKEYAKAGKDTYGMSPQYPLEEWITSMESIFYKTKMEFTHGKYYSELGDYTSECLDILEEIMIRLDSKIHRTNIANQMDAIAKEKRKELKKDEEYEKNLNLG